MKNTRKSKTHQCVTLEEVQRYMDYQLDPMEQKAFEEKIETCDECLELVESMQKGIMAEAMMKQEPTLVKMEATTDYEQILRVAKVRQMRWRVMKLVGSIVVFFGLIWLLWPVSEQNTQPYSNKKTQPDSLKEQKQGVTQRNDQKKQVATPTHIDEIKKIPPQDTTSRPIQVAPEKMPKKIESPLPKQLSEAEKYQHQVWETQINASEVFSGNNLIALSSKFQNAIEVQRVAVRGRSIKAPKLFLEIYDSTRILKPMIDNIALT